MTHSKLYRDTVLVLVVNGFVFGLSLVLTVK